MDIKPYLKNAKKHPEKQIQLIADSIERFGWQQPIVVDSKNREIIVGHGRYLAWQNRSGLPEPWVTDNLGNTLSGKQGKELTPGEVKAYRLADNKINESDWDMDLVLEDLADMTEELAALTGFEDIEYLGTKGMPTEDDWASAFDKETMPTELKGLKQVTFILKQEQVAELQEKLKAIGGDKNEALFTAVMAYDS